ncbi:MAG: VanZ family protein [Longimicrobiales bacterium]|nr:VanZ family protein [Longimicrobiales bacterium]
MPHFLRSWGPSLLWALVLFLASSVPDVGGPSWLPLNDKVAHFGLYGVLGATLAFGRHDSGSGIGHVWLLGAGLLYGASDEWHQMFVSGRSPEVADWIADALGVLVGYGTTWSLLGRTRVEHAASKADDENVDAPTGDGA